MDDLVVVVEQVGAKLFNHGASLTRPIRGMQVDVPELRPVELEQTIMLVGPYPRLYPPGIVESLERRRRPAAPVPPAYSPSAAKRGLEASASGKHPPRRHASG